MVEGTKIKKVKIGSTTHGIDATTVNDKGVHTTFNATDNNNFSTDKAIADYFATIAGNDGRIGFFTLSTASSTGTLTTDQYNEVAKDMCVIKGSNGVWYYKHDVTGVSGNTYFIGFRFDINAPSNGMLAIYQYAIDINNGTKAYTFKTISQTDNANKVYNVPKINSLLSTKQTLIDKSLYNIGEYDSWVVNSDGTVTITRQTGYLTKDNFTYDSGLNIWRVAVPLDLRNDNFVSNVDIPYQYAWEGGYNHYYYYESGYTNFFILSTDLSSIVIQYKLGSSFAEKAIRNQPLNTLNSNGSAWLQDEYSKTVNLFNKDNCTLGFEFNGTDPFPNADWFISNWIRVKPNTTYYLSGKTAGSSFITYDKDKNVVRGLSLVYGTYTANSNEYYVRFNAPQTDLSTAMLNEGIYALPYANFGGGKLLHQDDIEQDLIWANGNPYTSYTDTTVTIPVLSNYKYLIFGFMINTSEVQTTQYQVVENKSGRYAYLGLIDNTSSSLYHRGIQIVNTTQINFLHGYINSTQNDTCCIPVSVYGKNTL